MHRQLIQRFLQTYPCLQQKKFIRALCLKLPFFRL
uniref:Uncharacterized protein n=1 Tax=Anguilla anguilla TaxID=7936 RepID=A0A0E9S3X1_ANGAN